MLGAYDSGRPLARAETIPGEWYTDERVYALERQGVFGGNWVMVGRLDALKEAGQYITATVAGEPIVVVRGQDGELGAFFNVCRHHAAEVLTETQGCVSVLQCPYHGWTYGLDGALKATPEFDGVDGFDKRDSGLVRIEVDSWENFVFVRLGDEGPGLADYLGGAVDLMKPLQLGGLGFVERREYRLACNWKVYVDNYLDGGYHVPYAHKSLSTVLDYKQYQIECRERWCLQSSPMTAGGDPETAAVRSGETAHYLWVYPNFMINVYDGVMDTNLVLPLSVDQTLVIFDFYFADRLVDRADPSITVADRVQLEDHAVCESVQRGLGSRAYDTGRLSVRREAGEQAFHRMLQADLWASLARNGSSGPVSESV
ncbi:MAG: aromatic ring-hydroxylating dioxygenase subunit alpha, partial [Phycisphaerae bacterium]